ncbi:YdcF family protein [Massilia glaciei]|uniref:YdcF family protein n=1 Tax=Massilia glaciei TaxID=1524097 RepID=UPI001E55E0AD|nr:YdcF family protein [Massilia glaciei]
MLLPLGGFALATAALAFAGLNDRQGQADLIVVPGNAIAPDGTPSPRLAARLDAALALYREGRAPRVFVSGGIGRLGFDEAVSMSAYLVRHGVPRQAIIQDNLGVNTAATGRNAAAYMRANRLTSAYVATQYFHVPRTQLALENNGVLVTGTAHAKYVEMRDLYSTPREVVGYAAYLLGKN